MKRALIACVFLLSGCGTPTSGGFSILAPGTWFSHAPADKVDKVETKLDRKTSEATKEAQKAVKETKVALDAAEPSRAVDVAKNSNANAEALLDQTEGPLSVQELTDLKNKIKGLLSENKEIRAQAESRQKEDNQRVADISGELAKLKSSLLVAQNNLRDAFDRENALANELRIHLAWAYIASGMAILGLLGYLWAKIQFGGIPSALGAGLARISKSNGPAADLLRDELDKVLNRNEQAQVAKHFIAHS